MSDRYEPTAPDVPGWQEPWGDPGELDNDDHLAVAVADAARSILAGAGPLAEDELIDRIVTDRLVGLDDREFAADVIWEVPRLTVLRDGRLMHLPALAEGRTFTHRMTALEIEEQRVATNPDLSLYVTFLPPLHLAGGGEAVQRYFQDHDLDRPASLFGPPGWLPDELEAGALVACHVDDGRLTVTRIDEPDLDPDATARAAQHLRDTYDALGGTNVAGGPIDEPELLLETVVRAPTAFRKPVSPIAELLAVTGLDDDLDDWVVPTDDDPTDDDEAADDEVAFAWFEEVYGLDEMGAQAVRILTASMDLFDREDRDELPADTAGDLLQMLALDPAVVEALSDTQLGSLGSGAASLARLVRLLRPHARGRVTAALHLIEAQTAEAFGDAAAGEAALRRAVQIDAHQHAAHEDLAWYLEDRGDVAGALRHLRLAGVRSDDPQVERLTERQRTPKGVGRNDACPCGSGAKFKRCCERTGGPLPDRIDWIFDKIGAYLSRPLQRAELMPLVEARAGDASDPQLLVEAIGDPIVFDVALFEDEWLEDFLDERGSLLPADERELVRTWVGAPRSLFDIVEVAPGEGFELLDLRTGDRITVREVAGSRQLHRGDAIFARVIPDGVGHQLTAGVVPIPVQHRPSLLTFLDTEPSAVEICGWLAALEAPPTLVTMEGEPTVFCTAEYAIDDPEQAAAALRERFEADPVGRVFVDWVEVDGQRWGRGTVELEATRLRIQTNAEARLDRFKSAVEEVVTGAELLDESRRPVAEQLAAHRRGGAAASEDRADTAGQAASEDQADTEAAHDDEASGAGGLLDVETLPAEVRDAVEAQIRQFEQVWVDESIPMFGGLTPRQALADPTRREQLLAFLAQMDREQVPGSMSARRIRQLLGIGLP